MVKEETINGKKYYQCEICKFYYLDRSWAKKCENFCKEHSACSVEITKHAVELDSEEDKKKECDC
jgi:hypothetical protein